MASTQALPGNPKNMSSRLLTMKFMQRAAASPPSSPQTPDSHRSTKRQRLSNGHASRVTPSVDTAAIQAAIQAEEAKHQAALDRQRAASQETKWVFSCVEEKRGDDQDEQLPKIIAISYGETDDAAKETSEAGAAWRPAIVGRRSFGRFNRALEKQQNQLDQSPSQSNESMDEDDEESADDSDEDVKPQHDPTDATYAAYREATSRAKAAARAGKSRREKKPHDPVVKGRIIKPSQMTSISASQGRRKG